MNYTYQIFQLDAHKPEQLQKMYFDYDYIIEKYGQVDLSEYRLVYTGVLDMVASDEYQILERLFKIFNLEHPEDFHGHSLSVSDIVILGDAKFYCDSIGWKKL